MFSGWKTDPELKGGLYSIKNAADSAGFYNDIMVDSLSRENSGISFMHASPGFVKVCHTYHKNLSLLPCLCVSPYALRMPIHSKYLCSCLPLLCRRRIGEQRCRRLCAGWSGAFKSWAAVDRIAPSTWSDLMFSSGGRLAISPTASL